MSNTPQIVIRTEVWITKAGVVSKAVARDERGTFLGATNQTAAFILPEVVGKR